MPVTKTQSERLELAKAISSITTKQDAFMKSVETLQKYQDQILVNLDLEIDTKKKELDDLGESYERLKKNGQIDTDQFLKEYKYRGALQILETEKEVPIKNTLLEKMEAEIVELRTDRKAEIEEMKKEERIQAKKGTEMALRNSELAHKAESAELNAEVKQQKHEIINLRATIENLKSELAAQRELTKDVAQASRVQQMHYPITTK